MVPGSQGKIRADPEEGKTWIKSLGQQMAQTGSSSKTRGGVVLPINHPTKRFGKFEFKGRYEKSVEDYWEYKRPGFVWEFPVLQMAPSEG